MDVSPYKKYHSKFLFIFQQFPSQNIKFFIKYDEKTKRRKDFMCCNNGISGAAIVLVLFILLIIILGAYI